MAEIVTYGDIASVELVPTGEDFDVYAEKITITRFAQEGQVLPQPQILSQTLSDLQEGPTGEEVPFEIRALKMDPADATTLRTAGFNLEGWDLRYTSKDGSVVMVILDAILHVITSRIVEAAKFGYVLIKGKGTSSGPTPTYTTTVS